MTHPDLDRWTAWVHELLDPEDAAALEAHVARCGECREMVERLREEACTLAVELAPEHRLKDLRERLLRRAEAGEPPAAPRRGLLWQAPLAAALLLGLVAILAWPTPRTLLTTGRVALEDGRELSAPAEFAGFKAWRIRTVEKATMRLVDHSTVDLEAGSWIGIDPRGGRGVEATLSRGEARIVVAPGPRPLTIFAPAGRVETNDGTFQLKIVIHEEGEKPMKGLITGALVTVLAGSASLANDRGVASVEPGGVAALAPSEAPLVLASPQDAEALLKRLEQLAARVAKLEDEITKLEAKNAQLKEQVKTDGVGRGWVGGPGGGLRVNLPPGSAVPGQTVIIEMEEKLERANQNPNPQKK
jgi:hypothetical protein